MKYNFEYLALLAHVMAHGIDRPSRAGMTRSVFGQGISFDDLNKGHFPLLTSRQMYPKQTLGELAAFIRGAETVAEFKDFGCHYWDANAANYGDGKRIGKLYGSKWRNWYGVDQLARLCNTIATDPNGRRHILTTWDPAEVDQCLPPCHLINQYYVHNNELSSIVYMRSVDLCLGLPADMVLYATLLLLVARETNYRAGQVIFMLGDTHVYKNHVEQLDKQMQVKFAPEPIKYSLSEKASLFGFLPEHITFPNYREDYPRIKYDLNV